MPTSRRILLVLITWLAMLGADFLLNGAVFAGIYARGGSFMLTPLQAFQRIPIGYLAFLIIAAGLVEVAHRLQLRGWFRGVRLGLVAGSGFGAVWGLSLYSIATLGAGVAFAFALIWLALLTVGATVAAVGLGGASLRSLVLRVVGFDVVCAVLVIALQSSGVVQTTRP